MITPENKLVSSIIFKTAHLIEKQHWSVPAFDQSTTTERLIGCINKIKQNSVVNTCSILAVFPQLSKLFHFPHFNIFLQYNFSFIPRWRLSNGVYAARLWLSNLINRNLRTFSIRKLHYIVFYIRSTVRLILQNPQYCFHCITYYYLSLKDWIFQHVKL